MSQKYTYEELEHRVTELDKTIEDLRQANKKLPEREGLYAGIFKNTRTATLVIEDDMTISMVNRGFEKLTGYSKQEVEGKKKLTEFVVKEDLERMKGYHIQRREDESKAPGEYEFRLVDKHNNIKDIFVKTGMIPGTKRSIASLMDITSWKQKEKELREREEKASRLIKLAPCGIYEIDFFPQRLTSVNDYMCEYLGYKREELLSSDPFDLLTEDSGARFRERLNKALGGKELSEFIEYEFKGRDGQVSWFLFNPRIKYEKGKPTGAIVVAYDITKRKRMEKELQESEERSRTVLETNPDPIVLYDMKGRVTYFNSAFTRVFGWTLDECLGKKIDSFVPDDGLSEIQMMHDKAMDAGSFSGIETRRYTKEGRTLDVSISVAVYCNYEGTPTGAIANLRDITEKKRLKAQLYQAQKMKAIGTLAGGVAHDFNNLLMGILGNTSLLTAHMHTNHPYYEKLKTVEGLCKSGSQLTKQLLGLAREGKYQVKPVNLNNLLKKSSLMFGRTKKEIIISARYEEKIWAADVDEAQIEQVLLNIYVNAWQAMPGGGELCLETANVNLDEDYVKPFSVKSGKYVKISVTDTGVGMDEETMQRIFEPFFTTKEMGRGTGLGLASSYGMIKNHKGIIDVYSKKGEGTTFNIYIPASDKKAIEEISIPDEVPIGEETILLVDDEEVVLEVCAEMLRTMGYKVFMAGSGKDAVEIYKENKDNINIVILDMIMPDISGRETYERIKEINPKVKVILSSGYSVNGEASKILDRGCDGFLQKPFNLKQLNQSIKEVLNS